jgi:hypothetical protein
MKMRISKYAEAAQNESQRYSEPLRDASVFAFFALQTIYHRIAP